MTDIYFEHFRVGDRYRTMSRTITEADLTNFVGFAGFFEHVFISAPHATTVHRLKRRLIPGPMTYVLAEGLFILTGRMNHGIAYLGIDEMSFSHPVSCGDTIECEVEVLETRSTSKGRGGVVRCHHVVRNQVGTPVMSYRSSRLIELTPGGDETTAKSGT